MPYEIIKQTIKDNAWFGFNQVDYGLLHFQLATPTVTLVLLLILIFVMNKLLFQPVFKTLGNRQKVVEESKSSAASAHTELEKIRQEYERQLSIAQSEVSEAYNAAYQTAQKQRDELLQQVRKEGEVELEKCNITLSKEIDKVKTQLASMVQDLSEIASKRLLN